jgi:lactoylglutathione lyase
MSKQEGGRMRTLHIAYRVGDIDRSLQFYEALGYIHLSSIDVDKETRLDFLKLPDDPFVTLELVVRSGEDRVDIGNGFHHLVVQVDALAESMKRLTQAGLAPEPLQFPGGPDGPKTSWLTDPDGYRIELVEWPAGHGDGLTEADMP